MKWFKHISDSGDDPDIDDAIELFGGDGYYVFFRTLEVMSREFSEENPGKNVFSVSFFRKKFAISYKKVIEILQFYHERNRILVQFTNGKRLNNIELTCNKLKDLADTYTLKSLRTNFEQSSKKVSNQAEAEAEAEKEVERKQNNNIELTVQDRAVKNEKSALLILLRKRKIAENFAFDLINKHTPEFIFKKILHSDFMVFTQDIKNPPGYLINSIQEEYEIPTGFNEWFSNYKIQIEGKIPDELKHYLNLMSE